MTDFSPVPKPVPAPKKERKRPKGINAKRSADEFTRCFHSEERVEFVGNLPCIVPDCRSTHQDNAHVLGPDGMGRRKGYETICPLCRPHHTRLDTHPDGREGFEGEFLVDLQALALDTERTWRRYSGHHTNQESQP